MKRFFGSSAVLTFIIALLAFEGSLVSCTKDKTIYDTVTVTDTLIVKDTLIIQDTMMTAALLTASPWYTKEIRAVWGGDSIYFYRGGSNNTAGFGDYGVEQYVFLPDGTGYSIDSKNSKHPLYDWKFVNSENTKLTFWIHATSSTSSVAHFYTWENIRFKNKQIYTDEYFYDRYIFKYYHGQAIRYQSN